MADTTLLAGAAAVPAEDDTVDDGMQCVKHPYRNNASNGGICPLCLQEKLGNLVSSSAFNLGSSSPSFRSDPSATANAASLSLTLAFRPAVATLVSSSSSTNARRCDNQGFCSSTTAQTSTVTRRSRIPSLLTYKKKKSTADHNASNMVLSRSKSAVAPRRRGEDYSKRGGFWSFLYHSKSKPEKPSPAAQATPTVQPPPAPATSSSKRAEYAVVVDENVDSPSSGSSNATSSFGRKVSRSRSVGCGSRSFSGDFFERISTGFGDCTLRRVESQREGKRRSSGDAIIKEKVRCGGIFSGFMMTSSSSSSSDRLSAGDDHHVTGKTSTAAPVAHSRNKSWRWALASPMRAFTKPPSPSSSSAKDLKIPASSKSNATPNMSAIPSLLTVR